MVLRDDIPLNKNCSCTSGRCAKPANGRAANTADIFVVSPVKATCQWSSFLQVLKDKGFDDYLSHEIFNDEFRSSSPLEKAIDGMRSLIWLDDQTVSKREEKTAPIQAPQVKDVEFLEFAIEGESGEALTNTLAQLGFEETHRHRSKNVSLMRQGNINLILNREP